MAFLERCYMNTIKISKIAVDNINKYKMFEKECNDSDSKYDVVYIVKNGDDNVDLKYSLRSLDKFCNFKNVWIVGYKPSWVQNVNYLATDQSDDNKWFNSRKNLKAACENKGITDDFILMNDDFVAIRPIINWKTNLNIYLGDATERSKRYNDKSSNWQKGYIYLDELLQILKCKHHYDFEAHIPMIINKGDFLKMLHMDDVKTYWNDATKVFHQRSLYKNVFLEQNEHPKLVKDVKLKRSRDMMSVDVENVDWISVYDDVIGNSVNYPKLNAFLNNMFPNKCQFEA